MEATSALWEIISSHKLWLSKNATWEDVESMPYHPKRRDLYLALPIAICLSALRLVFERWVFLPLATAFRIFGKFSISQENAVLDKVYQESNIDQSQLHQISREIDWTVRRIERWLRQKRSHALRMKKFTEGAWRLTFYSFAVVYGFLTVKDLPWHNIPDCFPESLGDQMVTDRIRWYYLTELGFYISLLVSLLHDVRRKDFKMMVLHHLFTIYLIAFSWIANVIYVGSILIILHDVADVPMEAAKLFKYTKKEKLALISFVLFTIVWATTRLVYFPILIVQFVLNSHTYLSSFGYYMLNSTLVALFCLHLAWTWMIIAIIKTTLSGKEVKDVRSDSEESSEDELDSKTK